MDPWKLRMADHLYCWAKYINETRCFLRSVRSKGLMSLHHKIWAYPAMNSANVNSSYLTLRCACVRQRKLWGHLWGYKTSLVAFASRPDFNVPGRAEGAELAAECWRGWLSFSDSLWSEQTTPSWSTRRSTVWAKLLIARNSGNVTRGGTVGAFCSLVSKRLQFSG